MTDSAKRSVIFRYGAGVAPQLFGALVVLGLSYFFWVEGITGLAAAIWFSIATVVVLVCVTFGETQIPIVPKQVIRDWKFLGFIRVWRREYSLETFSGVQCRQFKRWDPDRITWMIGLVKPSGRFLVVQWFDTDCDVPCPKAKAFGLRLAEITGLPFLDMQTGLPAATASQS